MTVEQFRDYDPLDDVFEDYLAQVSPPYQEQMQGVHAADAEQVGGFCGYPQPFPRTAYQQPAPVKESHAARTAIIIIAVVAVSAALAFAGFSCSVSTLRTLAERPTTLEEVAEADLPVSTYSPVDEDDELSSTWGLDYSNSSPSAPSAAPSEPKPDPVPGPPAAAIPYSPGGDGIEMPYYFSRLDDVGKRAYVAMSDAVATEAESAMMPEGMTKDLMSKVVLSMRADRPDMFWVADRYMYHSYGDEVVSVDFEYFVDVAERDRLFREMEAVSWPLVHEAQSLPNDYEKIRFFYRAIVDMTEYDFDGSSMMSQTPEGVFLEHRSACAGYSRALQYLCYESGIRCLYVTGENNGNAVLNAGPHAWNLVDVDGTWSYTDVTWGDNSDSSDLACDYTYLHLTTSDIIAMGHVLDYPELMWDCQDGVHEEWNMYGSALPYYDADLVTDAIISGQPPRDEYLYLKFPDAAGFDAFDADFSGDGGSGAQLLIDKAPWLVGDDGYLGYVYFKNDLLGVIAFQVR